MNTILKVHTKFEKEKKIRLVFESTNVDLYMYFEGSSFERSNVANRVKVNSLFSPWRYFILFWLFPYYDREHWLKMNPCENICCKCDDYVCCKCGH